MADDKVKVVIAFDPADREREGKTIEVEAGEAHELVHTGRAQYVDGQKSGKSKSAGNTNNAAS